MENARGLGGAGSVQIEGSRAYALCLQPHPQRRGLRNHYDVPAHAEHRAAVNGTEPAESRQQVSGDLRPRNYPLSGGERWIVFRW